MLAILAAAATMAATPPEAPTISILAPRPGKSCGYWRVEPTDTKAKAQAQKLGDLPLANHELSVLKWDENGCSKPVIVRRNVNGDGRFANPR